VGKCWWPSGLGCDGVDDGLDGCDDVGGEPGFGRVAPDEVFAGRDVDAEDLVAGDVGVDPLDLGTKLSENGAGGLGCGGKLFGSEFAGIGDVAFDEKFRHSYSFAL